jgi:hypothetical protein
MDHPAGSRGPGRVGPGPHHHARGSGPGDHHRQCLHRPPAGHAHRPVLGGEPPGGHRQRGRHRRAGRPGGGPGAVDGDRPAPVPRLGGGDRRPRPGAARSGGHRRPRQPRCPRRRGRQQPRPSDGPVGPGRGPLQPGLPPVRPDVRAGRRRHGCDRVGTPGHRRPARRPGPGPPHRRPDGRQHQRPQRAEPVDRRPGLRLRHHRPAGGRHRTRGRDGPAGAAAVRRAGGGRLVHRRLRCLGRRHPHPGVVGRATWPG